MTPPPSIAVIGCGPGGMYFCHALEMRRRELQQQQDNADTTTLLPSVTCYEQASGPGGVWRAQTQDDTPNMYAALWTNGPSHGTEFHDYTYDEHFERPVSVYMPRSKLLSYNIARVTRHCPDFFEKYVRFQHQVANVKYDESIQKFRMQVHNLKTGEIADKVYDKVVWAGGRNGKQVIPNHFQTIFQNFKGRLIHSANTQHLNQDVHEKRVLMIGGSYSAEDLALQAIKLGAAKVYLNTRGSDTAVTWHSSWPMDKVTVLSQQTPVHVTTQNVIQFERVVPKWPNGYERCHDELQTELSDIDTVIFCTGYDPNFSMLDPKLGLGFSNWDVRHEFQMPDDWKMSTNALTELIGNDDVVPSDKVLLNSSFVRPEFYRGIRIDNPNMMFLAEYETETPMLELDAQAWLLVSFVTGRVPFPTQEEMQRRNDEQAVREMNNPYLRYHMDKNYADAVKAVPDIFTDHYDEWYEGQREYYDYMYKLLARTMQEGKYPLNLGTIDELNENGLHLIAMDDESYYHRSNLDTSDKENRWKTFRDYDNGECFHSLFTGTKAVPLEKPWMEMDVPVGGDLVADHKKVQSHVAPSPKPKLAESGQILC